MAKKVSKEKKGSQKVKEKKDVKKGSSKSKKSEKSGKSKKKGSNSGWINDVARLIKNPRTSSFFVQFGRRKNKDNDFIGDDLGIFPIKLANGMVINEGDTWNAKSKKDQLKYLVDAELMDEETAEKIAKTVKYEFSIPPEKNSKKRKDDDDEDEEEVEEVEDDEDEDEESDEDEDDSDEDEDEDDF